MGCRQGNVRILTHDFVHKTHLAIFKIHSPPILTDWCSPPARTRKHNACARTHTNARARSHKHKHARAHTPTPACARTHVPRPRRGDSDLTRRWAGGGGHGPF